MSAPIFGKDRMPTSEAETAPAWAPTSAVPGIGSHAASPEVSQFLGEDGEWHRFTHVRGRGEGDAYRSLYHAVCGAERGYSDVHTRTDGVPTCERCVQWVYG